MKCVPSSKLTSVSLTRGDETATYLNVTEVRFSYQFSFVLSVNMCGPPRELNCKRGDAFLSALYLGSLSTGTNENMISFPGDHTAHLSLHGTGGDGLHDDGTTMEEGDTSPDAQPQQGRRTRREACTCPYCKDNEGR